MIDGTKKFVYSNTVYVYVILYMVYTKEHGVNIITNYPMRGGRGSD